MVPSLEEVASSAELLGCLTIDDDRAKPMSSNVAHTRSSAIEADTAAAEAKNISVKRLYITTPLKDIDRVATLPFFSGEAVGSRAIAHPYGQVLLVWYSNAL